MKLRCLVTQPVDVKSSRRRFLAESAQVASALLSSVVLAGCGGGNSDSGTSSDNGNSSTLAASPTIQSFSPSAEAPGNVVVITGANFDTSASISFGGVAATQFSVDSATQISAIVPASATTGPITVRTTGGAVQSGAPLTVLSAPAVAAGYRLAWHDEFDGNGMNGSRWKIGSAVRDSATQTANAINIANSVLTISTYTDPSTGTHYTGWLDTSSSYQFTFGYIEAHMRFVNSPGQWSAFWLQSNNNKASTPPNPAAGVEVDIVEHRAVTANNASDISKQYVCNLHWNGYVSGQEQSAGSGLLALPAGESFSDWHTVGMLWTSSGYEFYLDGTLVWSSTTGVSLSSEFIRLTSEIRDNDWAGNIPTGGYGPLGASTNPVMQIDWVRVWQT